ncbi:MAG: MBL fold metallo-hydrolase [Erysipelotrichia bacterium]|nr:MBL fold metallo-hydrolase [Erysipelotrichia bacterium]
MKINYLLMGSSMLFVCLFNEFRLRIMAAFIIALSYKFYCGAERIVYRFGLVLILVCSIPLTAEYFASGYVCDIKDNYYVVTNGLYKVLIYDNTDIAYGSRVVVQKEVKPINYYNNFELSDFNVYCRANNIIGTVDNEGIKVENEPFSIKTLWYRHNMKIGNYWANRLLFGRSLEIDGENVYLITKSGLHCSFLFALLRKILNRHFYKQKTIKILLPLAVLFSIFMGFNFASVRIIVALVCELFVKERRNRLGIEIIALCVLKPYYVLSLSFLLIEGLKLIHLFVNRKTKIVDVLYLTFIQLLFYHHCYLLQIILFPLVRCCSGLLFLAAFIIHFPLNLNETVINYVRFFENFTLISVSGEMSLLFGFFFLRSMFLYLRTSYKKYLFIQILLLVMNNYSAYFRPYYTVTFMDIGQGDCCIITTPFSTEAFLIDTGGNKYKDVSKDLTIPYLESMNINKIKVLITHFDYDHYGGLESLIENFNVDNIYTDKKELLKFHDLSVFNPLYDHDYNDENDNSLISYIKINQFYFLFLADVSQTVENDLVNEYADLQVDVIKLSHHGSKTATSNTLLSNYRVAYAIISAGRNNRYGHPDKRVLERLNDYQIKILSTKDNHGIKFYIFNHLLFYITADNHWGIYLK